MYIVMHEKQTVSRQTDLIELKQKERERETLSPLPSPLLVTTICKTHMRACTHLHNIHTSPGVTPTHLHSTLDTRRAHGLGSNRKQKTKAAPTELYL